MVKYFRGWRKSILPVIDLNGNSLGINATLDWVEGDGPTSIAPLSDVTSVFGTLQTGSISCSGIVNGANEILVIGGTSFPLNSNKTDTGTAGVTTFSIAYVTATQLFVITKSGGGLFPTEDYQSLIRGITYNNITSVDPTEGDRIFSFYVSDQEVTSVTATLTVTVTATPSIMGVVEYIPSGFRNTGAAPSDGDVITDWLDESSNGYDLVSVGNPLYESTGTYAVLNGTSGGQIATPKYFQKTSGVSELEIQSGTDIAIFMAITPTVPADSYTSVETHLTNVPRQTRWGTGEIMAVASISSDLYEAGVVLSDDLHPTENGIPDIGAHQLKLGKAWHGPRRLQNGYLCGIPIGWEIADPADAATETGITETGTAVLYFKHGADYIAAWKQTSSGSTRWTNFDTELGTYYKYRDGLGVKTDYSKGARIEDDGLLVVYFSGSDEIAKTFMHSLYLPYRSATQQTSYGVTTSGSLTGAVNNSMIFIRVPFTSGDTSCTVEYKLAHEVSYRDAQNAFREDNITGVDDWCGAVFNCAPGETYDIRVTTAGLGAITTTAVTRKPMKTPTGTVRSATTVNIATILASAVAGDIIELAAGNYAARTITISGTQAAPIMFRPADEADPPIVERWTFTGDDIWIDGIKSRYNGVSSGITLSSATTRIQCTRLDIDANGSAATVHCIQADGTESFISDCWLAGSNSPRLPYQTGAPANQTLSYEGEGVECYDAVGCEVAFCDISRVGDVLSYGAENIAMLYTHAYDYSDDLFEADHSTGWQVVFRNLAHQGGNNCISVQESLPNTIQGPVYVIGNQMSGTHSVGYAGSGTSGNSMWKHQTDNLHTPWANNTMFSKESSQYSSYMFQQADSVFSNNVWGVKKHSDGQNRLGHGTLSYGANASWTGHMRHWSNNAYMATTTIVWDFATAKSLTAIQAKGVETNSILLANYGTTVAPAWSGDWINSLIYIGPSGEVDPTRPTGSGIQLRFNTESGFEFLTRHLDGVEDERVRVAHPGHSNPIILVARYKWSTSNGKEIILNTGERTQVDLTQSQLSGLNSASNLIFRVGANGIGENPLQASLMAVSIYTGDITDQLVNSIATDLATLVGTTWGDI